MSDAAAWTAAGGSFFASLTALGLAGWATRGKRRANDHATRLGLVLDVARGTSVSYDGEGRPTVTATELAQAALLILPTSDLPLRRQLALGPYHHAIDLSELPGTEPENERCVNRELIWTAQALSRGQEPPSWPEVRNARFPDRLKRR